MSVPSGIKTMLASIGIDADAERNLPKSAQSCWEVRPGVWAIKHKTIERLAAHHKIRFSEPAQVNADMATGSVAFYVTGTMGDGERSEWSFVEASPSNIKAQYPFAMAEKRAKDRVVLKLLDVHGDAYTEEEADDFVNREWTILYKTLRRMMASDPDGLTFMSWRKDVTEEEYTQAFNCAPKSKKTAFKDACRTLEAKGAKMAQELRHGFESLVDARDTLGATQAWDEMPQWLQVDAANGLSPERLSKWNEIQEEMEQ